MTQDLLKKVTTLDIVWRARFVDHREGVVDRKRRERQEACLGPNVRTKKRGRGRAGRTWAKLVVYPIVHRPGIGNQRYGMHFVTVDAEEWSGVRDAAWRFLATMRHSKAMYCVPSFP